MPDRRPDRLLPSRYCSIRLMDEEDLPAVMRIEKASYEFPWTEGIFKDCLKSGYHCLAVTEEHEVIGYGVLSIAAGEAHILNICIEPGARGNRFSRRLLDDMLDTAAGAGVQEVFLEVRPSNHIAINLYSTLGFNEVGRRPAYYNAGSGREDALIMVKSISLNSGGVGK